MWTLSAKGQTGPVIAAVSDLPWLYILMCLDVSYYHTEFLVLCVLTLISPPHGIRGTRLSTTD